MASNVRYAPLLRGKGAVAARDALAELSTRYLRLRPTDVAGASLADGLSGLALVHVALERVLPGKGHSERAQGALEASIGRLGKETFGPDLYGGFTGIAWVIDHLAGTGEEDDGCSVIDDALAQYLAHTPWEENFDVISGLAGIGVYALDRMPRRAAAGLVDAIVGHLAATAARRPPTAKRGRRGRRVLAWRSQREWVPEPYRAAQFDWNLGLAHGVPGVIGFLGRVCGSACSARTRRKARALLDGAVAWLLAQELPPGAVSRFGSGFDDATDTKGAHASRLAWCYGDPGISAALLLAARETGERSWRRAAVRIALDAAARSESTAAVTDAGLCHGGAGLAHIFHRLYRASGEEALAAAARRWFARALGMRTKRGGFAGFSSLVTVGDALEHRASPGFLTGAGGVTLALCAALTGDDAAWSRVLMLP